MERKSKNNLGVVILAAGEGSRLLPLTTPKPMIRINQDPNIVELVNFLKEKVKDITVISRPGRKYHVNCRVLYNSYAYITNTITSLYIAIDFYKSRGVDGLLILEGDHLFDYKALDKIISQCSVAKNSTFFLRRRGSGEWAPVTNCLDKIYSYRVTSEGEPPTYAFGGATYISRSDFLSLDLYRSKMNLSDLSKYWEEIFFSSGLVASKSIIDNYSKEFDNLVDLIDLIGYDKVAEYIDDSGNPKKITSSMTNRTYLIKYNKEKKILRLPGIGTKKFINRDREQKCSEIAIECGIKFLPESNFYNNGVKLTSYLEGLNILEDHDELAISKIISNLEDLHRIYLNGRYTLVRDLRDEIAKYYEIAKDRFFDVLKKFSDTSLTVHKFLNKEYSKECNLVLTHGDLIQHNIMLDQKVLSSTSFTKKAWFIDWEYSGFAPAGVDFGSYISELALNSNSGNNYCSLSYRDKLASTIKSQLSTTKISKKDLITWSYVTDFLWGLWGLAKTASGDDYYEYGIRRLESAKKFFSR